MTATATLKGQRIRGASEEKVFMPGERYVKARFTNLERDELVSGHIEKLTEEAARFHAMGDGLMEVVQHLKDGTKPVPAAKPQLPTDPAELQRIIKEQQAQLAKLNARFSQQPVKNGGGYATKTGRVFKSKPGRKAVS